MPVKKKNSPNYCSHHHFGLQIMLGATIMVVILVFVLYCYLSRLAFTPSFSQTRSLPALFSLEDIQEKAVLSLSQASGFNEVSFMASPDGLGYAYISKGTSSERLVINGEADTEMDEITFMSFSPDGQSFAYTAKQDGQELAVINGVISPAYDWIFNPRFFSPDSRYFIYKARNGVKDFLVINDWTSRAYDRIYDPVLLPDKSALVFFALDGETLWRGEIPLTAEEQ